jgi:phosphoribosylformylglycinamidine cyclo-ligase
VLPEGTGAEIDRRGWTVPPLFAWLVGAGGVPREDAWRTFNMGMGLLAVVAAGDVDRLLAALRASGETGAAIVGRIVPGDRTVRYLD